MPSKNLPVPPGPVAPLNLRFAWYIAPPALITAAYRLIPPRVRGRWVRPGGSTSHIAMRLILAGGGWAAFRLCAQPRPGVGGKLPDWFPESK